MENVDDVRQYSEINPAPDKLVLDGVAYVGNSKDGVNAQTNAVKYIGQNLTEAQRAVARTNIGLQNVDNVRQYSDQNPAPDKITVDGTTYTGNSADGVTFETKAVKYEKQYLTNEQKAQARENIGADFVDATPVNKGVVSIGEGITVNSGKISTSKDLIGLSKVENIRQYSDNNPAPDKITVDGVLHVGNSRDGVYFDTEAIKYVPQSLTNEQKAQARENIGANEITQADWEEKDTASAAYIKNKPVIPEKLSQLTNDNFTVTDEKYNDRVFMNLDQKNTTLNKVAINERDIANLKIEDTNINTNLTKLTNKHTEEVNDLQSQINILKGKTQILGGTDCPIGKEQTVLTAFARTKTGDSVNRPQEGDLINVISDTQGNSRNEQWQWIVIRDTEGQIVSQSWQMVSGPPIVNTATTTGLGVAMFPLNGGLMIDNAGRVTADKTSIGLSKVDNVRQYSKENPAPIKITLDEVTFNGDTSAGVKMYSGAVLYDRNQTLTENEKKRAKTNLGITSGVKPNWNAPENDEAGILNKPTIPKNTSELVNDSDFIVDPKYVHTDYNFTQAAKDNIQDNTNRLNLYQTRLTDAESAIITEKLKREADDNDLQQQIDALKGLPTFIGSVPTIPEGRALDEYLNEFVIQKVGTPAVKGYQVSVLDRNTVFMYNGSTWEVYLANSMRDATTTAKGLVQIGTGITVSNGVISADKISIGLNRVDNVQQYSEQNPVPIKITVDDIDYEGTSATGVSIAPDHVRYTVAQNLTEAQKKIARQNIGAGDDVTKADWDAPAGSRGEILHKPVIPDSLSQLANDNNTVIDINYEDRVFTNLTQKEDTFERITQNETDISDLKDEQIEQNNEIEKLKKKSFWVGSIDKFDEGSTEEQKSQKLTDFVLQKTGGAPGEGYQVSVLADSSVYQYSSTTQKWEVFVENQVIQVATTTNVGVIKVGKGLSITKDGTLSSEGGGGGDWNVSDPSQTGYIKNRTHYETEKTTWQIEAGEYPDTYEEPFEETALLNPQKYPVRTNREIDVIGVHDNIKTYTTYVKVLNEIPGISDTTLISDVVGLKKYDFKRADYKNPISGERGSVSDYILKGGYGWHWVTDINGEVMAQRTGPQYNLYYVNKPCTIIAGADPYEMRFDFPESGLYVRLNETVNDDIHQLNYYQVPVELFIDVPGVKQLDAKYIPDEFATKEWVLDQSTAEGMQADWNEVDIHSGSFIKNKPFGVLPVINATYDGHTDKSAPYLFVNNGVRFQWCGDQCALATIISSAVSAIQVKLSDSDDTFIGIKKYSEITPEIYRFSYTSERGTLYHFAVVDKDQYDADGALELKRGVYIAEPKFDGTFIEKLWSNSTYNYDFLNTLNGESLIAENGISKDICIDRLFDEAYNPITYDMTEVSLNVETPTYTGDLSPENLKKIFGENPQGISLSQGNGQNAGIYVSGKGIAMWTPGDDLLKNFAFYNTKYMSSPVFTVNSAGKFTVKSSTDFYDKEKVLATKDYVDRGKLFDTAHDFNKEMESSVSLGWGVPKYCYGLSDSQKSSIFGANPMGTSLSQGNTESSGIYFDNMAMIMWSPCNKNALEYYNEDTGELVFQVDANGKGRGKTSTVSTDNDKTWATKDYVDKAAVPDMSTIAATAWSSGTEYTVANNGWIYLYRSGSMSGSTGSSNYWYVRVRSSGGSTYRYHSACGNSSLTMPVIFCPVAKGDLVYFYFSNSSYPPNYKYFIKNKTGY